jgi:hypothetical protein
MSKWSVDFGVVQFWQSDENKFEPYNMVMSYDESSFPLMIKLNFEDGSPMGNTVGRKLELEYINSDGLTRISDWVFNFTSEQLELLHSIAGKWLYVPDIPRQVPLSERIPGDVCHDFGLVYWYSEEKNHHILAHMELDFDQSQELPVALFLTTYDDSLMPDTRQISAAKELSADYLGEANNSHHYSVCGQCILLSTPQVDKLNHLLHLRDN